MTAIILRHTASLWRHLRPLDGALATIVLILLGVMALDPDRVTILVPFAMEALLSTLPYIAVAVLLIGWLKASDAESMIARVFEGREVRMIVLAALFGGLAPFCSCEVIPFIAGLLALGAPVSAVMAFWLSSPLIDPPTVVITASALGWQFAIGKTVAAVFMGLLGGFSMLLATRQGLLGAELLRPRDGGGCGSCCGTSSAPSHPQWRFWRDPKRWRTFAREAGGNAVFLIKWLSLAYLLEALLVTYVPAETIGRIVGGEGLGSIFVAALVGMPAYLNGYAAPALVAGLMEQGMGVGAAMAFMVAGAISCIPAMAAVWSLVKPQVFAAYIGLGIGGAVLFGALFQMVV